MVLVVDNYDSFTYNIVQYIEELGARTLVLRSDELNKDKIRRLHPEKIIISPGPGQPQTQGKISCGIISEFYRRIPILGVCLGHQCIGYVFGARIVKAPRLMHGKVSLIYHNKKDIYRGMPDPFSATRYHSLIIERKSLPSNLLVNATSDDGIIMGIKERRYPLFGVQFHPESILTKEGKKLLNNFLQY